MEQRIFNNRLSRARRVVENSFGILANRFQVLLTTMQQSPATVKLIVKACLVLHNLMRIRYPALQNQQLDGADNQDGDFRPGAWRGTELGGHKECGSSQHCFQGGKEAKEPAQALGQLSSWFRSMAEQHGVVIGWTTCCRLLWLMDIFNNVIVLLCFILHVLTYCCIQPLYLLNYRWLKLNGVSLHLWTHIKFVFSINTFWKLHAHWRVVTLWY